MLTAGAAHVHRAVLGPADVVQHLKHIARHLRRGVPQKRPAGLAHAAVIDDQHRVLGAPLMAEVHCLPLPGRVEDAEAVEELRQAR